VDNHFDMKKPKLLALIAWILAPGLLTAQHIGKIVEREFLDQPELRQTHVGISLFDPATATYLYNYQADKYFVPASNTKLFTLYAGLKYLGDSLVGIRYRETDTALFVTPTGDPSFLHPDFPDQPVVSFLQHTRKPIYLADRNWREKPLGRGWAWDDYNEDFMAERSSLPVYGNRIRWVEEGPPDQQKPNPAFEPSPSVYSIPEVDWEVRFTTDTVQKGFFVQRDRNENRFQITEGKEKIRIQDVPFITDGLGSALLLLKDTLGKAVLLIHQLPFPEKDLVALRSRPADSLFKPMMWNSDNFFAEQTLLMVGKEKMGKMNDADIIDHLLKNDLQGLPQKPVWVDGSGLSRYDLFTPQDFVWLLDKMGRDFGLARMERLLPTGGTGTLANYYKADSAYIFAKTGSMSGVVSLCGYLVTEKGRLLIFSVMVNNNSGSASVVRRQIEKLIHTIRQRF
jgi:D-alanyl-D-alanine carboxypeptidase/D-alanyl-D-alanine-endopeptidase (penicillin-binding protein 4)